MTLGRTTRCQDETSVGRREEFILDCARELLLSRGYNRVTVEDIAEQARIGKGTVYLHWESKAQLIAAVLHREALSINMVQSTALRKRPETVLLPQMAELNFRVIMQRPLYRALYIRDSRLLGRFSHQESSELQRYRENLGRCYADYFGVLHEERLINSDVGCQLAMTVMESLCLGLVVQAGQLGDNAPMGELCSPAEVLRQTLQRAFAPPVAPSTASVARAAQRTADLFDELRCDGAAVSAASAARRRPHRTPVAALS